MKNRIVNALLAVALRDIASILSFIGKLEGKLEAFLDQQQKDIDDLDAHILDLATERSAMAGDLSLAQNIKDGVASLRR